MESVSEKVRQREIGGERNLETAVRVARKDKSETH